MKLERAADTKDLKPRVYALMAMVTLGLVVLAGNLYRLMVIRYEEFLALSVDNQFKDVRVRAPRGLVKDRRGEVLVDSRPSFDVFITPAFCLKCAVEVIPRLAAALAWDEERVRALEAQVKAAHGPQRYQPMVAQVDLTREEFDVLTAQRYLLPGVDVEPVPHRHYRSGTALAHVLGYMAEVTQKELVSLNGSAEAERPPYAMGEYTGRRGLERSFESDLRGQDGWVKQVVDARGQMMRDVSGQILERDVVPPRPGNNMILSIDARLQAEAERVFPGRAGAIVALDAKTGFVLAMVSRPSFDPNEMTGRVSPQRLAQISEDPLQPMIFRAGAEHYHPGSTFKPVTLLAALSSGVYTPSSTVVCPGSYSLGSRVWRCHLESGHGAVQARKAIQQSCDTYFYHAADLLGIDPIAKVGKAFGLGAVTGLSGVAEVPGIMPDSAYHDRTTPGGYQKGMALNTAIGQGDVNVTPLQLAVMYAAIGNGGLVWQPQIVRKLETPAGEVVKEFQPVLTRKMDMTPEQHALLVDALVAVVNEPGGTALRARLPDVTVAGKTGTAQVLRLAQGARLKESQMDFFERDHAWFAAFAPAEDPEIAVVVLNEHGGHGGTDASPAASALLAKYFELRKTDGQAFGPGYKPPKPPPPIKWGPPPPKDPGTTGLAAGAADAGPSQVAGTPQPVEVH